MRKTPDPHRVEPHRAIRLRPRLPIRWVVVVLALTPLCYEGGLICYARWCEVFGRTRQVESPVTAYLVKTAHEAGREVDDWFRQSRWEVEHVLMAATIIGLGSMLMLRAREAR